jgi:hypothetical protein
MVSPARTRTLEGQRHNVDLAVLAPVSVEFFEAQEAPRGASIKRWTGSGRYHRPAPALNPNRVSEEGR